jgi:hypothetical protein
MIEAAGETSDAKWPATKVLLPVRLNIVAPKLLTEAFHRRMR